MIFELLLGSECEVLVLYYTIAGCEEDYESLDFRTEH